MTKLYAAFLLLSFSFASHIGTAQVVKHVQFSFSGNRDEKGAFVSIKARIADKVQLFTTKKKSADDPFISTIEFDSTSRRYLKDSLVEVGQLKTAVNPAAGAEVRYFTDSVEWKQRLNVGENDSAKIKGTITWLAGIGDQFPTGDETFSVKIVAVQDRQLLQQLVLKMDLCGLLFYFAS
jgi:hypothetical protein